MSYVLLEFIVGALFAIVSLLGADVGAATPRLPMLSSGCCSGWVHHLYAHLLWILGFVFGLIGALLYNGVARVIMGIEIEMEDTRHASPSYYS